MRVWLLGFTTTALMSCTAAPDDPQQDAAAPDAAQTDGGTAASDAGTAPMPPVCDVVAPTACPDPMPRYADVEPIFQQRCLSCHDGKGKEWPLVDYAHIASWFREIQAAMLQCKMPPLDSGVTMPVEEREAILAWIRCDLPR